MSSDELHDAFGLVTLTVVLPEGSYMPKLRKLSGGSLSREQFLLRETQLVADLRLQGNDSQQTIDIVVTQNLFQYPTERSLANITRVCLNRLDIACAVDGVETPDESPLIRLIANGDPEAAAQANLYLMMCAYDVVAAFMLDVVAERYQQLDPVLTRMDMQSFFTDYCAAHPKEANWADSTITKIIQVLRNSMAQSGHLANASSEELIPIVIDLQLEDVVRANGNERFLPAFNCIGVV